MILIGATEIPNEMPLFTLGTMVWKRPITGFV